MVLALLVGGLTAAAATPAAAAISGTVQPAAAGQLAVAAQPAAAVAAAGATATASVDLAGTWSFTPKGRGATSITVPGGGWYKQGFTDVNEAVYSRSITVPDSGQPQSTWIEFGAVNHEATLSVDGRVVATQTTAFTPSNFDISSYAAPGTTHTISVNVKGRGALKASNGRYLVPDAATWSEAVPQGIFGSAFLRVYPAVYVSDTFVRTSVANKTLTYDVSVRNTSSSSRSVTLTGSLSSINGTAFSYPALPSRTVTVAARSTATVTVGPVAWTLDSTSYWWPNVPYRSGYRAQLHGLTVHAVTDDGRTSDATYRFGFREATQNGEYYYLNGVRANFRGDNLQGADYDRVNNGGKGDAYHTLPGFLPPSQGNGGWPQAVDNYQRLNYNVVRIHQEPASPYMLDVADEMGLMIIGEVAIRGSQSSQEWKETVGHDNMVNHARALVLRDRNHPAIIRWSQNNEPNQSGQDSEQFEKELYAAMNGADGTRPVIVEVGVGNNVSLYPGMTYSNFAVIPHYVDGFGKYGERVIAVNGRPDGEGEFIWPACNTKQGFEWFATSTLAKRGKDASDLRPYTLLSAWASVIPGVRTGDFVPEEGGRPIYGADNLPDPWSNPQIQRVQAAFNPVAAVDLPYWSASGNSDSNGTFPLASAVPTYARERHDHPQHHRVQRRLHQHVGGLHLDGTARRAERRGRRVREHDPDRPARLEGHPAGVLHRSGHRQPRVPAAVDHEVRSLRLHRRGGVLQPRRRRRRITPGTYRIVNRNSGKPLAIAGNSTADGAKAVQQTGTGTWTVATAANGSYTLRYVPSGKVLDVNAKSTTAGLQLQQWTANGGTNQMWFLRPTGNGYYTIVSHDSGLVADVSGAATNDGAQVVQWAANGGANQQWQLIRV